MKFLNFLIFFHTRILTGFQLFLCRPGRLLGCALTTPILQTGFAQLAESLYPCVNLLVADNVFLCGLSVILPVFQAFLSNLQPLILACFP